MTAPEIANAPRALLALDKDEDGELSGPELGIFGRRRGRRGDDRSARSGAPSPGGAGPSRPQRPRPAKQIMPSEIEFIDGAARIDELAAVDPLHRDEAGVTVGEELHQLHQVRVADVGEAAELALERQQIVGRGAAQRLDRNVAIDLAIVRAKDQPDRALADALAHVEARDVGGAGAVQPERARVARMARQLLRRGRRQCPWRRGRRAAGGAAPVH